MRRPGLLPTVAAIGFQVANALLQGIVNEAPNDTTAAVPLVRRASNVANDTASDGSSVPFKISNNCGETVWPGIKTDGGVGLPTHGFELGPGKSRDFRVSWEWRGRIWPRTNCTFNEDGSGPKAPGGVDGSGAACMTGDCAGRLDCDGVAGRPPATLAEFTLRGGSSGDQTYYDISLVDGYNIPTGIVYIAAENTTWIPPNLVNPSCIATRGYLGKPSSTGLTYTNKTFPMPYESLKTNDKIGSWCPWPNQIDPPEKPGDGVYPYPDDNIERPIFNPCLSNCAKYNTDEACCRGDHNDPAVCRPTDFSRKAKAICPDAYSYAYDDGKSTFVIPSGGGWEVVFCPTGRSTNILRTFGGALQSMGSSGVVSQAARDEIGRETTNDTFISVHNISAASRRASTLSWVLVAVLGAAGIALGAV